ncbi:zinc finger protein 3 homolog [Drosophila grimshawi]|uniref:GH25143 n=1 Tax=Drosophila grimshawi TaxID=7222 RepID=B4JZH3_DROGR|nr:zinc finger protein 3 homolog [Drosophila grimshawi]EDV94095.1 GH25143 [Drosophila grimshawi]
MATQKMLVEITTDGVPKLHCPVCNKALVSLAGYVKHVKKHEPPGGFQCRYCDAHYCHEEELKQHIKETHSAFVCRLCVSGDVIFSSLEEHDAHIEEQHQDSKFDVDLQPPAPVSDKPFKCEICGKCFADRESSLKHRSEHANSLPVECKCCAMRFSCISSLTKHQRRRPDTCGRPEAHKYRKRLSAPTEPPKDVVKKKRGRPRKAQVIAEDSDDDDVPLASRLKVTAAPVLKQEINSQELSDSAEEYPDFEPNNSDDEPDAARFKLPTPATVKQEAIDPDFEYQDASLFVKEEGSGLDIYSSEKDKLLDVLLNQDEGLKPFENLKVEHATGSGILDEIAAVPMLKHNGTEHMEEDVLALRETDEDDDDNDNDDDDEEFIARVPRQRPLTKLGVKRKYRKRGEMPNAGTTTAGAGPRRVAKITKKELKERLKMLSKMEKSWKCPHCVKIYHIRKPYEKHLRDDHKLSELAIKELFKDVDAHAKLDDEVFKCKICSKIYLVEKRLETHMKVHGQDGSLTFKCPCYCNLFFASKELATQHAHELHKELLYCEKCDKYMTGHDSLKNHEKNYHARKEPRNLPRNLICDKCGKKFTGRTSLSDHVRSECGRMPLYECKVCNKRLSTAGILKTHMLLHQSETPYQCDKCGKTFKVKAQYKSHLKTRHTDYKPYKCHLCPKEYPYRESLLTHMTVHTGIKRFLCNNCGKRFTCISNLQAHRKVHADTCGQLPLNAKATQYMGVQRGKLLMGAKPEAGMEYEETKTLIAQDVIDRDMPMAQELNFPSDGSAPLATVPLNYASSHLVPHIVLQTMQAEARK